MSAMISDVTKLVTELKPLIELLTLIAVGVTAWIGVRNSKKIAEVHDLTNSMSNKLQVQAGQIGEAKGEAQGRKDERADNVAIVKAAEATADKHIDAAEGQGRAADKQERVAERNERNSLTRSKKE